MKTNWQDPGSVEITSPMISGLQEAVGKIEDSIGLKATAEVDMPLTEVYIEADDRYRIYQVTEGKRNWVASPAPVIYKNGVAITTGFAIDYGGGAIILDVAALGTDVFTADFTRTNSTHSITPASIGAESKADADAHKAEIAKFVADYEYQSVTVVGTQIQVPKQSSTKLLKFRLDADLTGGDITISLDGGVTSKPLLDIDDVPVTELLKGFVEVVENTVNFTHAPKGARLKDIYKELHDLMPYLSESAVYGGDLQALIYDGTYLYVSDNVTSKVYKIDPSDMSKVGESISYGGIIIGMTYDGTYLYIGGATTKKVWKIDPSNMSKVAESDDYGGDIWTLTYDGAYLYVGGWTTKKVWKIDPSNMSKVAESDDYGGFIYAIVSDGTYLYIGGATPQKVWKIDPSNMSKVAESADYGGAIRALAYDGTYLYAAGDSVAKKVWKIDPSNMSKVAESADYGGFIYAIVSDGTYLYIGGATPQKVWKIDPSNMSKVAESADYGGTIRALAYDGTYLYVGGSTTRKVWKMLGIIYFKEGKQ